MPKKFIRKCIPDPNSVKSNQCIKMFGSMLHDPSLWHLNRRSAKGAFGIGLFFAFWPVPFQMLLSAGAAIPLRVNLPLSMATVWVTNPLTMPPIYYVSYLVGCTVLGTEIDTFNFSLSWEWFMSSLKTIGPAFIVGSAICSVIAGLIGYFGLDWVWRWSVINAWNERRAAKKAAQQ